MGAAELAALARSQAQTIAVQDEKIAALEHQIEWFRRQSFGRKSERFAPQADPSQMHLGETRRSNAKSSWASKHARRSALVSGVLSSGAGGINASRRCWR
jgi:hypothetical protein